LLWLAAINIFPDDRGMDYACEYGHTKVVKWIKRLGKLPTHHGMEMAQKNDHQEIVKMMEPYGVLIYKEMIISNDRFSFFNGSEVKV
jgi:hypothetical protein